MCLSLALKEIRPSKADGNDALNTSDVWTPGGGQFNRGRRENEAGQGSGAGEKEEEEEIRTRARVGRNGGQRSGDGKQQSSDSAEQRDV